MIVMLERVLGREVVRHYLPGCPFDVLVSALDNSLARQELGWVPQVTLEEGIVKTAEYMREVLNK